MRSLTLLIICMLFFVSLAAAFADVVIKEPGAPANCDNLPWADRILHSDPVLDRGIAPNKLTKDYSQNELSNFDENGDRVAYYVTWTTGRHGEKVWLRVHPKEMVESKIIAQGEVTWNGKAYMLFKMHAKRFTRCGNPTSITWTMAREILTKEIPVPGPERKVKQKVPFIVKQTETVEHFTETEKPVYPLARKKPRVPQAREFLNNEKGFWDYVLGPISALLGRPITDIEMIAIAKGGQGGAGGSASAAASAAASASASAAAAAD